MKVAMIAVVAVLLTGCSTFSKDVAIDVERGDGTVTAMGKGSSLHYDSEEIQRQTLEAAREACPTSSGDSSMTESNTLVEVSKAMLKWLGSHRVKVTHQCGQ